MKFQSRHIRLVPVALAGLLAVGVAVPAWADSSPPRPISPVIGPVTEPIPFPSNPVLGPRLPAVTGSFLVGTTVRRLVDTNRPDPWVPTQPSELLATLWYPTLVQQLSATAPYLTKRESDANLDATGLTGQPRDILTRVATNSTVDSFAATRGTNPLPLIVLSPDLRTSRKFLTNLGEEFASHGFIVVTVDHLYEPAAVSLPDGRVVECVSCTSPSDASVVASRAADLSFVVSQLTATRTGPEALIDPTRIAVVGHGLGGSAAVAAMLADPRIRAGVTLDGDVSVGTGSLDRPLLMVGSSAHDTDNPNWGQAWDHLGGWRRWVGVDGARSASFTDVAVISDQLGGPTQALPGARASELTRTYVAAFLDLHLRGLARPLLDGPTAGYPEVRFVRTG